MYFFARKPLLSSSKPVLKDGLNPSISKNISKETWPPALVYLNELFKRLNNIFSRTCTSK